MIVATMLVAARAQDENGNSQVVRHADGPVCEACKFNLIFPNNGSHTSAFKPCFAAVDEACSGDVDAERYGFCTKFAAGDPHGMAHIIEMENWKLTHCEWTDFDSDYEEPAKAEL